MSTAAQLVENLLDDKFDPKDELKGMRERDPKFGVPRNIFDLDEFARGYLEAAFFSDEERLKEEATESGLDPEEHSYEWAPDALVSAQDDCDAFRTDRTVELLDEAGAKDDTQNGRDFWFTRNHHGVGFWDRGYEKEYGKALTDAAHAFGEKYTYLGDDGLIYLQ